MKKKKIFSKPLVSVIINCRNGEKFLQKCIKSVIYQSYSNWEIIFFDNNSKDNSKNILNSFKDKRINYFSSNKPLNLYHARNIAVNKAKGKYITFLDVDDWWVKCKLTDQIKLLKKIKSANFIYTNLYIYNDASKKKYSYFKKKMPSGRITQSLLNDYKIGISTVMMNRKFFFKKKFNKNYNIIGDFDFFINLSLQENFYCIQKPLIYFRKHKNNYSKKIYTYLRELDDWSKKNLNKLKKANISLNKFRFFCYKLKLKKAFGWGL